MRAASIVSLAILLTSLQAHAATFYVDSTIDAVDADPGDGVCAIDTGECTLRAAVMEANALPGRDEILLRTADYELTIEGERSGSSGPFVEEQDASVGDLDLLDEVLIKAPASPESPSRGGGPLAARLITLVADDASARAFEVAEAVSAEIHDLVIRAPALFPNSPPSVGAGILNLGQLFLEHVTVERFRGYVGAGIFNAGTLRISKSVLRETGKVAASPASLLANAGDARIVDTLLGRRRSGEGGALWSAALGTVEFIDSEVLDSPDGGGIENHGVMAIEGSTIAGNGAFNGNAGGIFNMGDMAIVTSTISGNTNCRECRRLVAGIGNEDNLFLGDSTVTKNRGTNAGSTAGVAGPGVVGGSIIAGNENERGFFEDCQDTFVSDGYNLIGTVTRRYESGPENQVCFGFDDPSDQTGTADDRIDPQLGPLADNGGPTLTHMPLPGSPVIDADLDCAPGKDQRGVPRPLDGDGDGVAACDIGSVEYGTLAAIDIKPRRDRNPINLMSNGLIPVAIFGSDTFDVRDVDVDTLAFGPRGAAPFHKKGGHRRDVDEDGFDDLVSHYKTGQTGITLQDEEACVTGKTFDGVPFGGCDLVQPLGIGCGLGFELVFLLPPLMWLRRRRAGHMPGTRYPN